MKALFICSERTNWNNFIGFFRDHLSEVELFCARNGSDSMDIIIHESPISVIIIDNQLQDEEQISIAEDIFEAAGQKPIIFLGDESSTTELITSEFFSNYKTNEIIEKPYPEEKLKSSIEKALEWSKTNTGGSAHKTVEEEEYLPVKLKSFYLYDKVAYDVYYMVYTDNYMKVLTNNKRYTESTIQNLAKKNIKDLYLIKSEKIKFLDESMQRAIEILTSKNSDQDKKISTQICGVLLIHEMVNEVGVSDSVLSLADLIVNAAQEVVKDIKDFGTLFAQMPLTYGDLGEQAIFMLYLCHYMNAELEWESDMTFRKLGLACILHDCKLKYDDLSLIRNIEDEQLKEYNLHSLNIYKEHMLQASQVSTEFNNFPDCSFIIREHHTLPEKKYTNNMNSISCLFTLVRRLTTELANFGFTKMGIKQALPEIQVYEFGNFKKPYDAILKIFSIN